MPVLGPPGPPRVGSFFSASQLPTPAVDVREIDSRLVSLFPTSSKLPELNLIGLFQGLFDPLFRVVASHFESVERTIGKD
jgi:hypothetical protein